MTIDINPQVTSFEQVRQALIRVKAALASVVAGSIPDGDKGDIEVTGGGTVWELGAGVVDSTALGGDVTTAGKAMATAATAAAQLALVGGAAAVHTHVAADVTDFTAAVNALLPSATWTTVQLGGDFTTSATTPQTVTGFKFTPATGKTYLVEIYYMLSTTVAATAPRFGIVWPTGMDDAGGMYDTLGIAGSGSSPSNYVSGGTSLSGSGTGSTTLTMPALARYWMVTGAGVGGDLQVVLQAEASGGGTVGINAGSFLRYMEVA